MNKKIWVGVAIVTAVIALASAVIYIVKKKGSIEQTGSIKKGSPA